MNNQFSVLISDQPSCLQKNLPQETNEKLPDAAYNYELTRKTGISLEKSKKSKFQNYSLTRDKTPGENADEENNGGA